MESSSSDDDESPPRQHQPTTTTTMNSSTSQTTQKIARHVRRRSQIQSMQQVVASTTNSAATLSIPKTKIGWLGKVGRLNPTQRLRFFRLGEDYLSYYRNGSDTKPEVELIWLLVLR